MEKTKRTFPTTYLYQDEIIQALIMDLDKTSRNSMNISIFTLSRMTVKPPPLLF